jgi:SpoVK/Ycf46/Vps4 family AAA+-type ATPase
VNEKLVDMLEVRGKAGYAAIYLQSMEDQRVLREVREAADAMRRKMYFWTYQKGLIEDSRRTTQPITNTEMPGGVFPAIKALPENVVIVLRQFHHFMTMPEIQAPLLDLIPEMKLKSKLLIVLSPVIVLPPELEKEFTLIEAPLPDEENLKVVLDGILDATQVPRDKRPNEQRTKELIDAAKGLTTQEAENAFALSFAEPRKQGKREIHDAWDANVVIREKCLALRKTQILEYVRDVPGDMGVIGGMDNLKEWVTPLQRAFTQEALDFGLAYPKGLLLVGPPGCLSGDTELVVNRAGNARRRKLKDIVTLFNGGTLPGGNGSPRKWDPEIPTMLQSRDEEGNIRLNQLTAAINSGVKKTYTLTTENGNQIRATADHRFLALHNGYWGWVELRALQPGSVVCVDTGMLSGTKGDKKDYPTKEGMKHHPYAVHDLSSSHGEPRARHRYRAPTHRLVMEAAINDLTFEEFIERVRRGATWGLTFLGPDVEVHHRDRDTKNYSLSNLEILPKQHHKKLHGHEESVQNVLRKSGPDKVVSITEYGEEEVFDLTMTDPLNNFVANGIVVHNCGKSLFSKVVAGILHKPLLKLDMGRIYASLVGQSEGNIRMAIRVAEAIAPCVLWLDEIEKGVSHGGASSGDSGVSSRVLGTLLTWMQEKTSPVFVVATANDVSMLPAELLRKGRFDEVFSIDLPNKRERKEILTIHINRRRRGQLIGKGANKLDLDYFSEQTSQDFTGAEIDGAIEQAMRVSFHHGRDLNSIDLQDAFDSTQPIAKTMQERLDALRAWCKARTRPANKADTQPVRVGAAGRTIDA